MECKEQVEKKKEVVMLSPRRWKGLNQMEMVRNGRLPRWVAQKRQ